MNNYEKLNGDILDKFWTIPNIITIIRMVMVIPIVYLLIIDENIAAFILLMIAYMTDTIDGMVARATKSISRVGKILDPLSDKLITIAVAITLLFLNKFPAYFFIMIIVRDALILFGALYSIKVKNMLSLPLFWGKLNTLVLGVVLTFYPLRHSVIMGSGRVVLEKSIIYVVDYGTYISAAILVISFIAYFIAFAQNLFIKNEEK